MLDRNPIASGWFSDSWMYRKTVILSAAGTNVDVLVPLDSSTLISEGKMRSDCADIRFVDSDDSTLLSHWIEGGCNTTATQIWVRVPSSSANKSIYMYYGNSSANSTAMSWNGKAILYSTSSCPTGWSRETAFDNRFAYGGTTYGTTGGSSSHNHGGSLSVRTPSNSGGGNVPEGEDYVCGCHYTHQHNVTGTISDATSLPPYMTTSVCSANTLSSLTNLVFLSDTSVPSGWTREAAFDGKMPYGSASAGTSGGAASHIHTLSSLATSASQNNYCVHIGGGGSSRDVAWGVHTHSVTLSSNGAGSNYPPYKTLLFVKNPSTVVTARVISMFSTLPPLGWTRYAELDNFFTLGGSAVNLTAQGSATHSHALSFNMPRTGATSRYGAGVSVGFAPDNHTHTASTNLSGSSIPPYITVIYGKRNISQSVSFGGEVIRNLVPNAPTSLLLDGENNPTNILNLTPTFSAIFSDPDSADKGTHYQIQVNTSSEFNGISLWDSGQVAFANEITNGTRIPDISYEGLALSFGNTYYWRIKFWDNLGAEGVWSATAQFTTLGIPATPTVGVALPSINSILWNFTYSSGTEDGVKLYDDSDNLIKTCVGSSINSCEEDGLLENTQYTRKISAYNQAGESPLSSPEQVYTAVRIPSFAILSKTSTTVNFTISDRINDSEILLDCSVGTNCNTNINQWVRSDSQQVTDLENNTNYGFRIKGRNGDNVDTEYSATQMTYTHSAVPTLAISDITSNSLMINASGVNNVGLGDTGFFFECVDSVCNSGIKEWVSESSDTVKNLLPDTEYRFRAKSRNYDGAESTFSEYITTRTLSAVPNPVKITDVKTNELRITVDTTNNPSTTKYLIQEEKSGKYIDATTKTFIDSPVWFSYAEFGGTSGIILGNLTPSTEYTFVIKGKSSQNIETDFSEKSNVVTKIITPTGFGANSITTNEIVWQIDTPPAGTVVGYRIYDERSVLVLTCSLDDITSLNCRETNLFSNTIYKRKIQGYNSISESAMTETASFNTLSELVKITSANPVTYGSMLLKLQGSSRDSIQIFETTEQKYYDHNTGVMLTFISSSPFRNEITISGLKPNRKYTFQVRSLNKDGVSSAWSEVASVVTFAQPPVTTKVDRVSASSARVYINNLENPAYTEFVVRDSNSGKYLDYSTSSLVNTPKYGKFSDFGGSNGFIIDSLEVGEQYGFSVAGRNMDGVLSIWSNPIYIGTKAIILNVKEGINVVLATDEKLNLTSAENGQFGEQKVKVFSGKYLLAEIPILFSKDRDWSKAVIDMSATEKKTVIKLTEDQGLANKYTMFVVADDTNSFILCPEAKSLKDVNLECLNGVKYTGEFPQSHEVKGNEIAVSKAIIGGINYWVVDGLTGTGGLGYNEEKKDGVWSGSESESLGSLIGGYFLKFSNEITGAVKAWMTSIDEKENLTNTAALSTVTVATTAVSAVIASGGLLPTMYAIGQFFTSMLVALGFKKKNIPYGIVYNSKTKEPLSMVVVRIFDKSGSLVNSSVTDGKGRFMTRLEDGEYTLSASKGGFLFPSKTITSKVDHPLTHVYSGSLTVKEDDIDVEVAVPMDPVDMDTSAKRGVVFRRVLSNGIVFLNLVILLVGIVVSVFISIKQPSTFNLVIPTIYIIPLSIVLYPLVGKKNKYWCVVDEEGKPLVDVSVFLKDSDYGRILQKRVTDEQGRYRFVVDKGNYEIGIEGNEILKKEIRVEKNSTIVGENFVN